VRRREFVCVVGGAAAWPLAARAQQQRSVAPEIGFLVPFAADPTAPYLAAFRNGLAETGFVEGRNVAIEARYAQHDLGRLAELAADLVRRRVKVIATLGGPAVAQAATTATATIPIVFEMGGDPVRSGVVASLNRPGGNATGVAFMGVESEAKRLGLLHMLLPSAKRIAVLASNSTGNRELRMNELRAAAGTIGVELEVLNADSTREIDAAFASLAHMRADALLVSVSFLYMDRAGQIATLAARHGVPSIHFQRQFAAVGGLMSYGPDYPDQVRQVAVYVGRILKGERLGNLPIMQPTKFEFVINLQTARALGIEVPPGVLSITDAVIE
jgi:ABC-type uncharacterized transport system substrate-binding protein